MAVVSRLQLNHPALGATGGAPLHAQIEALYQAIGDAISSRWFQIVDFDNGETTTVEHNFDTPITNLRWKLFIYTGGTWVFVTDQSSPAKSAFTVAATVGFTDTKIDITNVSGGNDLLAAFVVIMDPLSLEDGDITDVDVTGAEEGQALVYDSATDKFRPGASGDSSFKLQSVTTPNLVLKGGYEALSDGKELATYSGSGTALASYGVDLTLNLTTIFGGAPVDATNYYLYIDLSTLGAVQTISDTGRKVYRIVQANFFISTATPETVLTVHPNRYVPIGILRSATTGNAWSGSGSAFTTYANKKHNNGPAWDQSVSPEDGQALVYDILSGKYKPGASGDSSFKLQTMSANVGTVKAGSIFLDDGKELYLASDQTFNFKTAVNSLGVTAPGATTAYYVYLDLAFLPAQTSVGNSDRKVYAVTTGTSGMFVVLTTRPEVTDLARYVPLYSIKTDGSSNYVSGNFANLAVRRHQLPATNVSPLVYEDADHSIGTVGSAGQLATYGQISNSDFSGTFSFWNFDTDDGATITDDSGNARNLTKNGSAAFTSVGLFGKETIATFDGVDDNYSSADATFNVTTGNFSMGGWFATQWNQALITNGVGLMGKWSDTTQRQYLLYADSGGVRIFMSADGSATTLSPVCPVPWKAGELHHIAAVFDNTANTVKLYLDGQLANTTAFASNLFSSTAVFRIGSYQTGGAASNFMPGQAQDVFFSTSVLTDSQINVLYSKRFKGQQLAGGHALGTDSFPLASLSNKVSYFPFSANVNDASVNAKPLSGGTAPASFAGLGLFGAADAAVFNGTSTAPKSTDSYFNVGNGHSLAIGGWFALDDWTPSASNTLFCMWNSGSDRGLYFQVKATGSLQLSGTNTAGADSFQINTANPGFVDGSWHHLVWYFDYPAQKLKLYVDGVMFDSTDMSNLRSMTSAMFQVGALQSTPSEFLKGRLRELFFIKDVQLTDQDFQKLVSVTITPTNTVRTQDQDWKVNYLSEDGQIVNELSDSGLIDKDDTKAWFLFGGGAATRANIRLYDQGLGAATVPVRKFDKQYVAQPGTTIAHGLVSMPTDVVLLHNQNADGKYVHVEMDFPVRADSTNLYFDVTSLTIDATHDLRVVASVGVPAIGTAKVAKLVTTTYSAAVGEQIMTDSSGGAFTITLPATPAFGDQIEIFDGTESWVPNNVTLARNGSNINGVAADFLCNVDNGKVRLFYVNSTQGWRVYP